MCLEVAPQYASVLGLGVDDVGISWINLRIETVAAAHGKPVGVGDAARIQSGAGPTPYVVVLQAPANVIWLGHIEADLIELGQWDGVDEIPGASPVMAHINAAVRTGDDVVGIPRINPHRMVVAVDALHQVLAEGAAAVV